MSIKENARAAWKDIEKAVKPDDPAAEPAAADTPIPINTFVPEKVRQTTVIAVGTTISGNITTDGDLQINGTVRGDLVCEGTLQCCGTIDGNISAQGVLFNSARVRGNIKANGTVRADEDSMVIGNVEASDIVLDGKLQGDLLISGRTQLEAHSVLLGDITTDKLSILEGSRFSGTLKMTDGMDLNALFDQHHG